LTDFNIAVYLPPEGKFLKSVAGTMAYMAPEILEKKGYLATCDWWSLGVLLFECAFGKVYLFDSFKREDNNFCDIETVPG
jgi:serine/threonine kinase 32